MRAFRLMIDVLLAASLAILPVAAGMAKSCAADPQLAMSAPGDECPCCNAAKKCPPDICMFKCYHVPAIAVRELSPARPLLAPFDIVDMAIPSPFSPQPDPPPPRS